MIYLKYNLVAVHRATEWMPIVSDGGILSAMAVLAESGHSLLL